MVNYNCAFCGRSMTSVQTTLVNFEDMWIYICGPCYDTLYSCNFCEHSRHCGINEDASGLPKIVNETHRMGNSVIQYQVKNPQLVDKYCPSCHCRVDESCYLGQLNCPHWTFVEGVISHT